MKKRTLIAFGLVMFLCAPMPMAMAGTAHRTASDTVDLGLIALPRHDFEQMKAMLAGTAVVDSEPAARSVVMEPVGPAEMTAGEAAVLRQMVAGDYIRPQEAVPSNVVADIQLGLLSMPQDEYDALQSMVCGYRTDWWRVFAGTSSPETPSAGR